MAIGVLLWQRKAEAAARPEERNELGRFGSLSKLRRRKGSRNRAGSCPWNAERKFILKQMEIQLEALGQLIARCWNRAEKETATAIAEKYRGPGEENITFLFARELAIAVEKASNVGDVARSFIQDLRRAVPALEYYAEQRLDGLVARVNFHNRQHEGKISAADLGIVIRRPVVQLGGFGNARIEISLDHASGLLAQAKLGVSKGDVDGPFKWRGFTRPQERLFPTRHEYYSLLLYRLSGKRRDKLGPFAWQLCDKHTFAEAKQWLASGAFPREYPSSEVLRLLFERRIGTEDKEVIAGVIDPDGPATDAIEIHISWPDNAPPPPCVDVSQSTSKAQRMYQRC